MPMGKYYEADGENDRGYYHEERGRDKDRFAVEVHVLEYTSETGTLNATPYSMTNIRPHPHHFVPNEVKRTNFIPHHYHSQLEFCYCNKGEGDIFINGEPHHLRSGDIAVINPYEMHFSSENHCIDNRQVGNISYICLLVDPDYFRVPKNLIWQLRFEPISSGARRLRTAVTSPDRGSGEIHRIMSEMYDRLKASPETWDLTAASAMFSLFEIFYRYGYTEERSSASPRECRDGFIEMMTEYVGKNYSKKLTLASAAAEAGYNPKYFCRLFKRIFGVSFIDYLTEYRIAKARELLCEHRYSVTQISEMTGFGNSSYFTLTFRKATGYAPTEYAARY